MRADMLKYVETMLERLVLPYISAMRARLSAEPWSVQPPIMGSWKLSVHPAGSHL